MKADFQAFNPAFVGLMGRDSELSPADMDAYADFIHSVLLPPNPFRNLDDSMPSSISVPNQNGSSTPVSGNPNSGLSDYVTQLLDAGVFSCNDCHSLPTGTNNALFNGALEGDSQDFKIPHMRNMYEKIGFDVIRPGLQNGNGSNIAAFEQKAGFGFVHDGAVSLTEFLAAGVFNMNTDQERDMFAFMLAFPTETKPSVGAQISVNATNKNDGGVVGSISTLIGQAEAGACDVIAKARVDGVAEGWVYDTATDSFLPDSLLPTPLSEASLRARIQGADVLTYTGVPSGAGVRLGIDRDRDTFLDRSEQFLGDDAANPNSNFWGWSN